MVLSRAAATPQVVVADNDEQLQTAYSLLLLSEYTHTLDSLPLDLSRNFADLRELDAVLSSSMTSINAKINTLTAMIEDGSASKEDKLWLLTEISDEASRLKLGDEDKIRVACQAADNIRAHGSHLRTLAETLPGFDSTTLNRKTVYPHVSAQSFMPVHVYENGRRRRNGRGLQREEDIDIGTSKSPRKSTTDAASRRGAGSRGGVKKATERAVSPEAGSSSGIKRNRNNSNRNQTPLVDQYNYDPRSSAYGSTNGRSTTGNQRDYATNASSNSFPNGNSNTNGTTNGHQHNGNNGIMQQYDVHGMSHLQNWNPPNGQALEGPGMPVSRVVTTAAAAAATAGTATPMTTDNGVVDGPDVDGDDGDEKRYCFCNGISYGEMIGCDGEGCE